MNWGTCKLRCLQTMYSNEGGTLNADDSNQEYLDAMPGKANEGMQQMALVGRPILKEFEIAVTDGESTGDGVSLPSRAGTYRLDLKTLAPRFRAVSRIMLEGEKGYGATEDWDLEGDNVLVIPANVVGTYRLWYAAYPAEVQRLTPDETELDLPEELAALLPIYMAAELYKEDDLALSTILRNEYEDGLQKVRAAYDASGAGCSMSGRRNMTGWW